MKSTDLILNLVLRSRSSGKHLLPESFVFAHILVGHGTPCEPERLLEVLLADDVDIADKRRGRVLDVGLNNQ